MKDILLVILAAIIGPLILNWLNGRRAAKERREDWLRQDQVAEKAATAVLLNDAKLNQIHTLVNSEMTSARQELLDQTKLLLGMYRRTIQEDAKSGRASLPSDLEAVKATEIKIKELRSMLADRIAQQHIAEQEMIDFKEAE